MYIKIYFKDGYYYTYRCKANGKIIEFDMGIPKYAKITLSTAISVHGEPTNFMILIGAVD